MRKTIVAGDVRCYTDLATRKAPLDLRSDNLDPMTTA
jgi:hypothetical protein